MINQNEVSNIENNDDGQYSCEFLHPNIIQESVGINQDACLKGLSDLGFIDEDGDEQVLIYRTDNLDDAEQTKTAAKLIILDYIGGKASADDGEFK